jgi:hypothetical protein
VAANVIAANGQRQRQKGRGRRLTRLLYASRSALQWMEVVCMIMEDGRAGISSGTEPHHRYRFTICNAIHDPSSASSIMPADAM